MLRLIIALKPKRNTHQSVDIDNSENQQKEFEESQTVTLRKSTVKRENTHRKTAFVTLFLHPQPWFLNRGGLELKTGPGISVKKF